jgi:hypothetical protein
MAIHLNNKRLKDDAYFYLHNSELIHFNRNKTSRADYRYLKDAENFIVENRDNFSTIRVNNFYFDLAKAYISLSDFKKAFVLFNEIYQHLSTKDYTVDFYTHSRLLYCLCCYETGEIELMQSTAKSLAEFMKRNKIYFRFEQILLSFIRRELPALKRKSDKQCLSKLLELKTAIEKIFESSFERKVLNYFDYPAWIELKIERYRARD